MKPQGRNIFVSLLLAVFGAHLFLPLILFVSVLAVKTEQREFMIENFKNESVFGEATFTEAEFEKKHFAQENEIELNGLMCDIHSVEKKDGKYVVRYLSDQGETELRNIQAAHEEHGNLKNILAFGAALFFEKAQAITFHNSSRAFEFPQTTTARHQVNVSMIPGPPPDLKA